LNLSKYFGVIFTQSRLRTKERKKRMVYGVNADGCWRTAESLIGVNCGCDRTRQAVWNARS